MAALNFLVGCGNYENDAQGPQKPGSKQIYIFEVTDELHRYSCASFCEQQFPALLDKQQGVWLQDPMIPRMEARVRLS